MRGARHFPAVSVRVLMLRVLGFSGVSNLRVTQFLRFVSGV